MKWSADRLNSKNCSGGFDIAGLIYAYSCGKIKSISVSDFQKSLRLQAKHLNDGGILVMTLWYGAHREEFYEGLRFVYYTEQEIRELIPDGLKIETIECYTEMEQNDSLLVVLKRQV